MEKSAEIDWSFQSYDLESNVEKIESAIDYLYSFSDISKLIENNEALEAFNYVHVATSNILPTSEKMSDIYREKNFLKLLFDINEHYANICNDLRDESDSNYNTIDYCKNRILFNSLQILNFLSVYSIKMRIDYFKMGGTKSLIKMLDSDEFGRKFGKTETYSRVMANVNWLSKNADLYKSEWNELNSANIILKASINSPSSKMIAFMTFANIANDKQIDTLKEIHEIISDLAKLVSRAATNMQNTEIIREKQPFIEEDETANHYYDVYLLPIPEYDTRFTLTGILLALYKLSVNNKIKYDMYIKYSLKDPLKTIILKGSDIEKKYSLQLLAQLCFDSQVLDILSNDDDLKSYIYNLTKPENCTMKTMRKICEGIMWSLTMKNKPVNEEASKNRAETTHQQKQVMISYNAGSRETCIQIKEQLEKVGFKVWIDINEIHGSSLEAMARAVESSDFILMCVTEKYRQSINCQAEAQYSFKLKKKIIPLILQKGFENVDGWLGIIMGDKIFINFTKYPFEQCITRLLNELNLSSGQAASNLGSNSIEKVTVKPVSSKPLETIPTAKDWSEKQVDDWLNEKKVPEHICNMLRPCNGEVLYQLHKLRNSAPEFFYQSITKNSALDLKSVLLFSLELEKAFEK